MTANEMVYGLLLADDLDLGRELPGELGAEICAYALSGKSARRFCRFCRCVSGVFSDCLWWLGSEGETWGRDWHELLREYRRTGRQVCPTADLMHTRLKGHVSRHRSTGYVLSVTWFPAVAGPVPGRLNPRARAGQRRLTDIRRRGREGT